MVKKDSNIPVTAFPSSKTEMEVGYIPIAIHTANRIQVWVSSINIRYIFTNILRAGMSGTSGTLKVSSLLEVGWVTIDITTTTAKKTVTEVKTIAQISPLAIWSVR